MASGKVRYWTEGGGRIYDREWSRPGYVIKVWAAREDGRGLTDCGREAEAETVRLCADLNALTDCRAELAAQEMWAASLNKAVTYEYARAETATAERDALRERCERLREAGGVALAALTRQILIYEQWEKDAAGNFILKRETTPDTLYEHEAAVKALRAALAEPSEVVGENDAASGEQPRRTFASPAGGLTANATPNQNQPQAATPTSPEPCRCGKYKLERWCGIYATHDWTHTRERCYQDVAPEPAPPEAPEHPLAERHAHECRCVTCSATIERTMRLAEMCVRAGAAWQIDGDDNRLQSEVAAECHAEWLAEAPHDEQEER